MVAHLADVSIRSLLLALVAVAVLQALRSRRTAAIQHAIWAAVVCGMLALFALGQALPRISVRVLRNPDVSAQARTPAAIANLAPSGVASSTATVAITYAGFAGSSKIPWPINWSSVALYAYAAIALACLLRFATGMFLAGRLIGKSKSVGNFRESGLISVPLTVGWLRPKILLPVEWREWDREKLDAVLAHEGAHVRRRDGLVAALAGLNRCVFWFHPLAWILERKLALLAEQACDESCVATLGDRERYAQVLLEMARVVDGSRGRLRQHALTMAAASHIGQRIESILQEGRTFSEGVTGVGWAVVTLCAIPAVLGAGVVGLERQPPLRPPEVNRWEVPAPPPVAPAPAPVLIAQAGPAPAAPAPAAPQPPFEAAQGAVQPADQRLLVFYFDMPSMPQADQLRALVASEKFVRSQMSPSDLVTIMKYDGVKVAVLSDFTGDRDKLQTTIEAMIVGGRQEPVNAVAPATGAPAGQDDKEFKIFTTDRQLVALQTAVQMLGALNQKKVMMVFADGMDRNGLDNQAQLHATIDAAVRANVSLWPLDPRGLDGSFPRLRP